ncbi:MAG: diacylglycerol kinase family protein [Syntrophomonadaceae bacterium]|nr:diacylglycerol kinase family protein [Syntrophomonadaceae bacterium]MDD3889081.1 diacylglycerol kinase family protein [Syntrophomonadaceae bacterium]MDD4549491.1 diacylglycerol kinase family protein [Syntrophomonadaceae bacterium]
MGKGKLTASFSCAWAGIFYVFSRERNMKIHLLAATLAVLAGFLLEINRIEWGMLLLTIFFVLVAETINTAIEKTVDLITSTFHPLAGLAKNIAAGAVLLSAINAVIMAFIIFGHYLWRF